MSEEWTTSDDAELKRLRRKKARIDRNTNRKHKYSPRSTVRNKSTKGEN